MRYLKREQILGAQDRKFVDVDVPEWGGTLRIGEMTGLQRDSYEMELAADDRTDRNNYRAGLVLRCAVDEQGKPLFSREDLQALSQKSSLALDRVWRAAAKLNALTPEKKEEAEKNSVSGTGAALRSA